MAARSISKIQEAAEKLKKETGREPLQLQLDLGDLHSVRRAAQEFLSKEDKLDILFNNALDFLGNEAICDILTHCLQGRPESPNRPAYQPRIRPPYVHLLYY
jgi:NADP-dependent 3-hydroxy acid dehydrogenase YdfG